MKAFDRWAETQKGLIKYDEITSKAAKLAWRAALKWVLALKHGMSGSEIISPEEIEQELK